MAIGILRVISFAVISLVLTLHGKAYAADQSDLAISALEFGGSIGKLIWVSVRDQQQMTASEADRYRQLADRVRSQVDLGRTSSDLVGKTLNVVATATATVGIADPEPITKVMVGVAAWGAKKTGEAIGHAVIAQAEDQARFVLAQGLQNLNLSQAELQNMSPEQLRTRVAEMEVGGVKLRDGLRDIPGALDMLEAQSIDLAKHIGIEALAKSDAIGSDVAAMQQSLARTQKDFDDYKTVVNNHFDQVEKGLDKLGVDSANLTASVEHLQDKLGENTAAIQSMAAISYSGWTTDQKVQAVTGGLFPDLTGSVKDAVITNLQAQKTFEKTVSGLRDAAQDFGNLAEIAQNVSLPKDVVIGLQGAQVVAGSFMKFATGDMLGAVAGLTSLVGLGGPDAETERYAAMMSFLKQSFAEVDQKLTKVIELQGKTLEAIAALSTAQDTFRKEVLGQLDRIETAVLQAQLLLERLVIERFDGCKSLVYSHVLNGNPVIHDRDHLLGVLRDGNLSQDASDCFRALTLMINANIKPTSWSGTVLAASMFSDKIPASLEIKKVVQSYQQRQEIAYTRARDFFLKAIASPTLLNTSAALKPAALVARLARPVSDAGQMRSLEAILHSDDVRGKLERFRCTDGGVVSEPLGTLLCVGIQTGDPSPPQPIQLQSLFGEPLIGPQALWIMDTGMLLAILSDFAVKRQGGVLDFVTPEEVTAFPLTGPSPKLQAAVREQKGTNLIAELRLLPEVIVVQQAIVSGDWTAELAEEALYDPKIRAINIDPGRCHGDVACQQKLQLAVLAMQANPVLARNVITLGMRQTIADELGGPDMADNVLYRRGNYMQALAAFSSPRSCSGDPVYRRDLALLFPNWHFEYRATAAQKQKGFGDCPAEIIDDLAKPDSPPAAGSGPAVSFGTDFYVTLPSPPVLSGGLFEQTDTLKLALAYRDRLSQAAIDRSMAAIVKDLVANSSDRTEAYRRTAFGLVNDAWGFQPGH